MRSGPRRRPGKCRFGYYSPLGVGGDGRDVHTDPDGTMVPTPLVRSNGAASCGERDSLSAKISPA